MRSRDMHRQRRNPGPRLPAFILLAALYPSTAAAECSVQQRIDLAKAGYQKAEIETICSASTSPAGTPANTTTPATEAPLHELLSKGTIAGGNQRDYEKRRCNASEAGVLFREDGIKGYASIEASSKLSIDHDDKEMLIVVSLDTGFNTEMCIVMRVDKWKFGDAPNQFEREAAQYQAEYNTILEALKKRGIPLD